MPLVVAHVATVSKSRQEGRSHWSTAAETNLTQQVVKKSR